MFDGWNICLRCFRAASTTTTVPERLTASSNNSIIQYLKRQDGNGVNGSGLSPAAVGGIFLGVFFGVLILVGSMLILSKIRRTTFDDSSSPDLENSILQERSAPGGLQAWATAPALRGTGQYGKMGYVPREAELRRQMRERDPSMPVRIDPLTRFIVGAAAARRLEVRVAPMNHESPLGSSDDY